MSTGEQRWIHVGTVVDSTASSGRKVEYNGKEYDYVFDVDIQEGVPPLKLPYNLSENPYDAATRFLQDNELPMSYLDQVGKFIIENTKGATIGRTSEVPSNAYTSDQPTQSSPKYLPHTEYLTLSQAKWEPVAKKLRSFNEKLLLAGHKHIAMNPDGVNRVEKALQATMGAQGSRTKAPAGLQEAQRSVLNIITNWPYGDRLPGLDALRCFVLYPGAASFKDSVYGNLVEVALRGALVSQDPVTERDVSLDELIKTFDAGQINVNNVMMALRTVVNLFSTEEGKRLVVPQAGSIIYLLARLTGVEGPQGYIGPESSHLQIALTSASFNFACHAFSKRDAIDLEQLMQLCQVAQAVINRQSDAEVLFRALMTIGMILSIGGDALEIAKTLEVGETAKQAAKKTEDARIRTLALECLRYLKQ